MSAMVEGCYDLAPLPDPKLGPRKADVVQLDCLLKSEPWARKGGDRGGLAKRRTTNKRFVLRLAPIPKRLPDPDR
jgi:hypothetical protein